MDRPFGTLTLSAAVFVTNTTAVIMIGAPGLTSKAGAGAFGFFVDPFTLLPVFLIPHYS